eukprot:TRINITY_DN409_c1_g1_i1.p1 TRINITY_DN409_c1_g1~~TRINITY_DN409_c1_g1_i1.p1  ORF type:complete len:542 (+),score=130.39 TRINITY_DN409_c1_g1_i1:112-1737(+)
MVGAAAQGKPRPLTRAGTGRPSAAVEEVQAAEGVRLRLPAGTVGEVVAAHLRVPGMSIQKDVTEVVAARVDGGGLDVTVDAATFPMKRDPAPGGKHLAVQYIPLRAPEEVWTGALSPASRARADDVARGRGGKPPPSRKGPPSITSASSRGGRPHVAPKIAALQTAYQAKGAHAAPPRMATFAKTYPSAPHPSPAAPDAAAASALVPGPAVAPRPQGASPWVEVEGADDAAGALDPRIASGDARQMIVPAAEMGQEEEAATWQLHHRADGGAVVTAAPLASRSEAMLPRGPVPDPDVETLKVPQHSRLLLANGTVAELRRAVFSYERLGSRDAVEHDVFDAVLSRLVDGGLDIIADPDALNVPADRAAGRNCHLSVTYTPHPPCAVVLEVAEGGTLALPPGRVGRLLEADLRVPFHDGAGHGFGVDVLPVVAARLTRRGIEPFRVTQRALGVDFDPFPDHRKLLRIVFLPHVDPAGTALRRPAAPPPAPPAGPRGARRPCDDADAALSFAELLLRSQPAADTGRQALERPALLPRSGAVAP